ncbi:MAG: hypothetical protein SFU98_06565 [Leptospiraceae bacterium]|nr:hypothetical protein [Leptospiraceae bacterium]
MNEENDSSNPIVSISCASKWKVEEATVAMNIPASEIETRYPFLKILKEKESILMGINPSNKYQHELLKLIKNQNTIQNCTRGMLFTMNHSFLEQLQMDPKTAVANLNQLISKQLVTQITVFEFDTINKVLNVIPYFITHPSDDKNYNILTIFEELIVYSFNSIRSWFEARDILSGEAFLFELKWQFSSKANEEYRGPTNLFNPVRKLNENKTGITSHPDMIDYMSKEISRRILESNLGVEILSHGILMLKPSEILEFFEAGESFIEEKLIPPLADDVNYKFRIDALLLEKKAYFTLEKFPRKTSKFTASLAKEIKMIKSQSSKNPNVFPGSLALESVIKLEQQAEEKYLYLWKQECEKVKHEFKKTITAPSNKWTNLISFVKHNESLKYPPDVWKDLTNDNDLFYAKWHVPKSLIHVFTGKEPGFFKTLVVGMMGLPETELWKAQALKAIIEKNQKKLGSILIDRNFMIVYQELEKKIYLQFIPWYFRIFLYFPLSIFGEGLYDRAGDKVKQEQTELSKANDAAIAQVNSEITKEKTEALEKFKTEFLAESIKRTLDSFYFQQKKIPTMDEMKQYYPDSDALQAIIKKKNFRVVTLNLKNETSEVLMYPEDEEWAEKKSSLARSLDIMSNDKNPHIASTPTDKAKYEKAQKLLEMFGK